VSSWQLKSLILQTGRRVSRSTSEFAGPFCFRPMNTDVERGRDDCTYQSPTCRRHWYGATNAAALTLRLSIPTQAVSEKVPYSKQDRQRPKPSRHGFVCRSSSDGTRDSFFSMELRLPKPLAKISYMQVVSVLGDDCVSTCWNKIRIIRPRADHEACFRNQHTGAGYFLWGTDSGHFDL
jgi:hypothetical protein